MAGVGRFRDEWVNIYMYNTSLVISSHKLKKGSSGGSGHGSKRINSAWKRKVEDRGEYKKAWLRNHKRIHVCVEEKTFKLWLQAKFDAGYESFSDSDFATHLLSLEYCRRYMYM